MKPDRYKPGQVTRRAALRVGMAAIAAACSASAVADPQSGDSSFKPAEPVNSPIGAGKGIHPGRVVWAHDPRAATWDGKTGNWWDDASTDKRIVQSMLSRSICSMTGARSEKEAWRDVFGFFKQVHELSHEGYRPGEKIAIKLNCNQDRPGVGRFAAGIPSPHVIYSLVEQLITVAGVPGQDITIYDASRFIGDPIFNRIRANPDSNFQAINFAVNPRMAGNGRIEALPDKTSPVVFSRAGVPAAYPPKCVTQAKYHVNVALSRAHVLMGVTQTAKNLLGSIYFEEHGYNPEPLHGYASRDLSMGSYNCLVDLMMHKQLGGKTLLYIVDFLYVAETQNGRVIRYQSFDDHWCSSIFASQDPVAIDSVGLDFIRNEPRARDCRGSADNYLHEAAVAGQPPSGTLYNSDRGREPVSSLGVHEHWNNPNDRQYSRNLGKREGIELLKV